MQICEPVKKTFARFFGKTQLFTDGYSVMEGAGYPRYEKDPVLEVKSRELADLDFAIPDRAVGFVLFSAITAQVVNNGQIIELTSGEINPSGRHFFQDGDNGHCKSWGGGHAYGRIETRECASYAYKRQTSMRRYRYQSLPKKDQPLPEKVIVYSGEDGGFLPKERYICTFDFLETDQVVPIFFVFHRQSNMIRAAADKKGWIMPHQRVA